jgi:thiol:disulfide interchange protein DsbC
MTHGIIHNPKLRLDDSVAAQMVGSDQRAQPSTMPNKFKLLSPLLAGLLLGFSSPWVAATPPKATVGAAVATEQVVAALRKTLSQRIANIDEISPTQWPGVFEVRFGGTEIVYSDASGQFLMQGSMIDTKTRANLTEQRIEKLTAVNFAELPLKDALVYKQGDGSRKMAVFADPNCGYCKRLERDLLGLNNVTIYVFLMPILGPDSTAKSRDIWCAADAPQAWRAWMIDGVVAAKASETCNQTALQRNLAVARKHRITGTPALFFEDGTRRPGALPAKVIEDLLSGGPKKS